MSTRRGEVCVGTDSTDGGGHTKRSRGRSFWLLHRRSSRRSSSPAEISTHKTKLSAQMSTESSPGFALARQNSSAMQNGDEDEELGRPPRRTKSFRERTSGMLSRVARRMSRRRAPNSSPSSSNPSSIAQLSSGLEQYRYSPGQGPSGIGTESPDIGRSRKARRKYGSANVGENNHAVVSRGEVTSAEYTDTAGKRSTVSGPEIEVTDASVADISAAVQQLTNKTNESQSATPLGSPATRRRANTTIERDPNRNQLASLLAPKKWRSRNRLLCDWTPNDEELSWISQEGDVVTLDDRSVLSLSLAEQRAVRKLLHKQLEADLGVNFHCPKEPEDHGSRGLNHMLTLRSGKIGASSDKGTSPTENCVFGIPLHRVLEIDHANVRRKNEDHDSIQYLSQAVSTNSLDDASDHHSGSDVEYIEDPDETTIDGQSEMNSTQSTMDFNGSAVEPDLLSVEAASFSALDFDDEATLPSMTRTYSLSEAAHHSILHESSAKARSGFVPPAADSPSVTASSGILGLATAPLHFLGRSADNLLKSDQACSRSVEALTLSQIMKQQKRAQARQVTLAELEIRVREHKKDVPEFLEKAFEFLKDYGMTTKGIFRVAGSKRRCKQLRDDLDSGYEINFISGMHMPGDVADLVKIFLRDLPEPLLTRALFPAFVAAGKMDDPKLQANVLRLLICLLPISNRDTLHELLLFLNHVAQFADDRVVDGATISGHMMHVKNLAVVIGPNIMRPYKTKSGAEFKVSKQDQAGNQNYIHAVVASLIRLNEELFKMSASFNHELLLWIRTKSPPLLDALLQRRQARASGAVGLRRSARVSTSSGSEYHGSPASGGGNVGGSSTLPLLGNNRDGLVLAHTLSAGSARPTPRKNSQRKVPPKLLVDLDDFAHRSPENGKLVPSFAVPGSPLQLDKARSQSLNPNLSSTPLELLAITVHNLADRTPPECKRRFPPRSMNSDLGGNRIVPPDDALFANWQNRWPSSEDMRSLRSGEKKEDSSSFTSENKDRSDSRGPVLSDDAFSREDDLSPMSGELTPTGPSSHTALGHNVESTPMVNSHMPAFSPPGNHANKCLSPTDISTTTMVSSADERTPTSSRPSSLRSKSRNKLDRRYTDPSPRVLGSSQDGESWTRRGSRKIQRLRQYFESFHRGTDPQPIPDVMSPESSAKPVQSNNAASPVDPASPISTTSPGQPSLSMSLPADTSSPIFWESFEAENVETMV